MKTFSSTPPFHRPTWKLGTRLVPSVVRGSLILGFCYAALFIGAGECYGLWDKPPTNTPKPANTHKPPQPTQVPTDPPVITTNTYTPTYTIEQTPTLTNTAGYCICGSTPTAPGIPTCTFTSTPTVTLTYTRTATNTVQPGGLSSVSETSRTLPPTDTGAMTATQTDAGSAAGGLALAGSAQGDTDTLESALWTPINKSPRFPWAGFDPGATVSANAGGMSFVLLLAAMVMGGGALFALSLMNRKEAYELPRSADEATAALEINPITVGAFGFTARLAEQVPLLSYGERVVLSKVGSGIGRALHRIDSLSDVKRISVMGPQEFLQLTSRSPFLTTPIRGMGWAG